MTQYSIYKLLIIIITHDFLFQHQSLTVLLSTLNPWQILWTDSPLSRRWRTCNFWSIVTNVCFRFTLMSENVFIYTDTYSITIYRYIYTDYIHRTHNIRQHPHMNKSASQLSYTYFPFDKLGPVAGGTSRLCNSPPNHATADPSEAGLEGVYCS